jgi:dihydrofolate reductase
MATVSKRRKGADEQHGLGDAPELHTWVRQQDAVDAEVLAQATAQSGAVVMGRRLFDLVNGPDGWSKDMGYGAGQAGTPPFFVVTHSLRQEVRLERDLGMRFTFVSDLVSAIGQARSAATDGDVVIMGGGDIIGQALEQGLVEELRLHLAPMALGGGTPLFKSGTRQMYRQREVRASRNARAPHLRTRVDRDVEVRRRSSRAPQTRRPAPQQRIADSSVPVGHGEFLLSLQRVLGGMGGPDLKSKPTGCGMTIGSIPAMPARAVTTET